MKPNANLWAVDLTNRNSGQVDLELFVCAASASVAESKAIRHARGLGYRSLTVSSVVHKGTVDVF